MKEKDRAIKKCFREGPITPTFISDSITKHQTKTNIGAHEIFLGQVRADEIDNNIVHSIEYSAHEEMANKVFHEIRENAFAKYDLSCMHIYHSLGKVEAGEICLFVFASSKHRKPVRAAIEFLVEEIKSKVPVFGKEIFEDQSHQWKVNQ
jgi:molybdopterin synthase catalytic subunit